MLYLTFGRPKPNPNPNPNPNPMLYLTFGRPCSLTGSISTAVSRPVGKQRRCTAPAGGELGAGQRLPAGLRLTQTRRF